MDVKKCARCHRLRSISLFEKFKSGRVRATCNRCIQRDNYPAIDRMSFSKVTSAQHPAMTEGFNPTAPPPMLSPVSIGQKAPSRPELIPEAKMTPAYIPQNSREPVHFFAPVPPTKHSPLATNHAEPKLHSQNSNADLHLMPSLEAVASLQPDLAPLLSSLNESGSYVLLYIPCKMHHK